MNSNGLLGRMAEGVQAIKVKSILDLLIKALLFIILISLIADLLKASFWIIVVLISIVGVLFLFILFVYLFFAIKNPDYLRSESFQLKMKTIEMLGDKDGLLPTDPSKIIFTSAPTVMAPIKDDKEEL